MSVTTSPNGVITAPVSSMALKFMNRVTQLCAIYLSNSWWCTGQIEWYIFYVKTPVFQYACIVMYNNLISYAGFNLYQFYILLLTYFGGGRKLTLLTFLGGGHKINILGAGRTEKNTLQDQVNNTLVANWPQIPRHLFVYWSIKIIRSCNKYMFKRRRYKGKWFLILIIFLAIN